MSTQKKEMPMAFQPSSNDALYSPTNGNTPSYSDEPLRSILRSESAILSPSEQSDTVVPAMPPTLPERESVGSASQLPSMQNGTKAEADSWMDLYYKLVESHRAEREVWEAERRQLLRDRQRLQELLGNPVVSATLDGSKENDKVFYNAVMVKHANESLRRLSQTSGRPGATSSDEEEASSPIRRVSIAPNVKVMVDSPVLHVIPEDDPYSPQTTARIMSPVPENFRMDAGHTPRKVRTPRGSDSQERAPVFKPSLGMNDGLDEDKELASPKMLPTQPGSGLPHLDVLTQKLQAVAENPDENQPEALSTAVQERMSNGSDHASPRTLTNKPVVGGPPNAIHDSDVGVVLRKKRSSNFGAPFGKLN